jgi:hypothetical protein
VAKKKEVLENRLEVAKMKETKRLDVGRKRCEKADLEKEKQD